MRQKKSAMQKKVKIKFIIFDLDNTLYDFDKHWNYAHQYIFNEISTELEIYNIDYQSFMKEYLKQNAVLWGELSNKNIELQTLRILRPLHTFKKFGISVSERFCENFYNRMFRKLVEDIKPNPVINELISNLSKEYEIYVLTNGIVNEQQMKIDRLELSSHIIKTYISEAIGFEKPDKKAFSFILNEVNKAPVSGLMIGDSYRNDVCGALSCNINAMQKRYQDLISEPFNFDNIITSSLINK